MKLLRHLLSALFLAACSQAATLQKDLTLLGTTTLPSGTIFLAAAGSTVDLSLATVTLPVAIRVPSAVGNNSFVLSSNGTTWVASSAGAGDVTSVQLSGYFADPSTAPGFAASAWRSDLGLVIGTNVAPATSGTSMVYGNGSGGFSNVTVGGNLSFSGGTLNLSATPNIGTATGTSLAVTGNLVASGVTDVTPATAATGAVQIAGGISIAKGLNVGLGTTNNTYSITSGGQGGTNVVGIGGGAAAKVQGFTAALAATTLQLNPGGGTVSVGADLALGALGVLSIANNGAGLSVGTARPLTYTGSTGIAKIKGEVGPWAVQYGFSGSGGTDVGGFGAFGSTDAITYYWIGASHSSPAVQVDSTQTRVNATTNATNTTSGALRVGSNVGLSGTAGGSNYFGGPIVAPAATTAIASLNLPHGTAPTSPANGDVWTTTAGLYARINSATVGPFGTGNISTTTVDGYFADPSTNASFSAAAWRSDLGLVIATNVAPATSGTSILYANGSGGFSSVTVGGNLSFSGGTLNLSTTPNIGAATGTSLSITGNATISGATDVTPGTNATGAVQLAGGSSIGKGLNVGFGTPANTYTVAAGGNGGTNYVAIGGGAAAKVQGFTAASAATTLQLNPLGGTVSSGGTIAAPAATTAIASLNLPHGTAPSSPTNGDVWTTSAGLYARINGVTVGPMGADVWVIACSDETTALTTGTAKVTFRAPFAATVTAVRATLTTAQASGSILTVDVNESGTSILSTKLTIDNTEKTSATAATATVLSDTALADDSEITVDIDQVGASGATGLKVYIYVTR